MVYKLGKSGNSSKTPVYTRASPHLKSPHDFWKRDLWKKVSLGGQDSRPDTEGAKPSELELPFTFFFFFFFSTPAASHHSICSVSSWVCFLLFLHYTSHQIHPTNPTNPTNPNNNNNKTFTPIFSSPLHHQQQHKTHFPLPQNAKQNHGPVLHPNLMLLERLS